MKSLVTILLYAGIVQGFYMALLLNHNKRNNAANKYLAILLITMSLAIVHSLFVIPEIHKTLNDPFRIKEPFLMVIIPLIWLYVKKLEQPLFRFSMKLSIHFLPFVLFMSVNIPAFLHGPGSQMSHFLTQHSFLFNGIIWFSLVIQYSFYLIHIIKITHRFKHDAVQELSNVENVSLSWLKTFLYVFIAVFILFAVMFAGSIHNFGSEWMNKLVCLSFSLAIFILGYRGLFQKSIFLNADPDRIFEPKLTETIRIKPINESFALSLKNFMDERKPYQDPELTLSVLAKQLNMSRNQLSELINNSIGCNFYDFVNKYRVEDVKRIMGDLKYKDYSLLAIAFEAGFPSKSTFNSIFKKFTGLTPSEYRTGLS
jgi:AraC-like DNA-binding protein